MSIWSCQKVKKYLLINSRAQEIIDHLSEKFHPNYHLILSQKWKVVMDEKESTPEFLVECCKDLLPICDTLDGEMAESKGKIGSKWAMTEMLLRKQKLIKKLITKEEFLQEIKPWLRVQVESKRLILSK